MDMISEIKEAKTRKFAHITKNDNKVVNIFDWKEEIDPNLGESNLLLDITDFTGEIKIADNYDGKGFISHVEEKVPVKEETVKDIKKDVLKLIDELRSRVEKL
jgi:hypothetical protein